MVYLQAQCLHDGYHIFLNSNTNINSNVVFCPFNLILQLLHALGCWCLCDCSCIAIYFYCTLHCILLLKCCKVIISFSSVFCQLITCTCCLMPSLFRVTSVIYVNTFVWNYINNYMYTGNVRILWLIFMNSILRQWCGSGRSRNQILSGFSWFNC